MELKDPPPRSTYVEGRTLLEMSRRTAESSVPAEPTDTSRKSDDGFGRCPLRDSGLFGVDSPAVPYVIAFRVNDLSHSENSPRNKWRGRMDTHKGLSIPSHSPAVYTVADGRDAKPPSIRMV